MEDACGQIRIKRRFPGGGPCGSVERVAEASTVGDGCADAAHFPAKSEVVFGRFEFVSMADDDPAYAEEQSNGDEPELRGADARPGAFPIAGALRAVGCLLVHGKAPFQL